MVQRQSIAKTPVFYRLEQVKNGPSLVGYVRLKEFNALARKDLVTGACYQNTLRFIPCHDMDMLFL